MIYGGKVMNSNKKSGISYEDFIGISSLSKTIKNELVPTATTKRHIEENGIITDDELRAEKRQDAENIADDYYRNYINRKLSIIKDINWVDIFDCMKFCKSNPSKENKEKLAEKQTFIRKQIYACLSDNEEFNKMFSAKLFTDLLPDFIDNNDNYTTEEKLKKNNTITLFNRFYSSFADFFDNRKNMFSEEKKATSICYRIVNENAAIYFENIEIYEYIKSVAEQEIKEIETECSEFESRSMEQIFSPCFYGNFTIQQNIDHFNKVCGVINQHMNLYSQKTKTKPICMRKLHKQILSETVSLFETPHKFENDTEVIDSVNQFIRNINKKDIPRRLQNLVKSINSYDFNKIYIAKDAYEKVSAISLGRWNAFGEFLEKYYRSIIPGKEGKTKENKIKKAVTNEIYRSINDFDEVVNMYGTDFTHGSSRECIREVLKYVPTVKFAEISLGTEKLIGNNTKINEIKDVLDSILNIFRWTKMFMVDESLDFDIDFYPELHDIHDELEDVVSLYNKVRNYVTKKPFSKDKMKLYFDTPTLCSGWSQNQEFSNNSIILIRDNKYYLAIFNAANKPDKDIIAGTATPSDSRDYKKMSYNQLQGPFKQLPRLFISSTKWQNTNGVPEHILEGYKAGKHLKSNENFDIVFCRELIDYFKDCIKKKSGYKCFDFNFSDTENYNDISEFYSEVEEQGYAINWTFISDETIKALDEAGQIFLFQIYNKDFSEKSTGKKNLHTMYLENLFSEENLKNPVLKLNGGAEIFFREASIKNPIKHRKDSIIVNKTIAGKDSNDKDIRIPIQDDIYLNIFNHYNRNTELSPEAEALINTGKVEIRKAQYDIVKDRRYTVNKFFLHIPISINFKVKKSKNINSMALKYIAENNVNVIGICRGTNNMLFATIIGCNGQIIEQKSFNIVHNFDYKKKLTDRERAMVHAQKNWNEIGKIKELEEGYLSVVVHEIVKLMVKYHAVIALEDVIYGNKKTKLDARVFQKFSMMLINKLSYLSFKEIPVNENGGLLRGYQLANVSNLGKQNGFIFFVSASCTDMDPVTGFMNIFNFRNIKSNTSKLEFLLNFEKISYDSNKKMFEFIFDYDKFSTYDIPIPMKKWKVYTNDTRMHKLYSDNKINYKFVKTDITSYIIKAMVDSGINYSDGHNLLEDLNKIHKDENLVVDLFTAFRLTVQLTNYEPEILDNNLTRYDRFISPILCDGTYYDSSNFNEEDKLPCCADAVTSYHIALKGVYEVLQVKSNWSDDELFDREVLKMSNEDWLKFRKNM